jgi:hypothetical protein
MLHKAAIILLAHLLPELRCFLRRYPGCYSHLVENETPIAMRSLCGINDYNA